MFRSDAPRHRQPIQVGRVLFEVNTMNEAIMRVIKLALDSSPISVRLANAYCVALASADSNYGALLIDTGINFPDGAPVVWFMRWRARRDRLDGAFDRVRGPSLFSDTIDLARGYGVRHFFLGSTPGTVNELTNVLCTEYPGVHISGAYSPPFGPLSDEFYADCASRINGTNAQIVWVALGTPKQDFAAVELSRRTSRPCIAVGAAFDFAAGTTREAPKWVQNSGIEWLYRLVTEPRRLWRRYLIGNLRFLYSALRESST